MTLNHRFLRHQPDHLSGMMRAIAAFVMCALCTLIASAQAPSAPAPPTKNPAAFKVEVVGNGQPMILIPGVSSAGASWEGTVAHYRNRYECHVLTLAGFAGQPALQLKLGASYVETMRSELASYIRAKKLNRPILVGHSLGGFLALGLAAREPALVGKIVAVDSLPFLGAIMGVETVEQAQPLAEKMRAGIGSLSGEDWRRNSQPDSPYLKMLATDPAKIALTAKWSEDSDPQTVAQVMYELMTTDLRQELGAVKAPVLVFASWIAYAPEATRAGTEQGRRAQFARLQDWRLRITDTARHFIMLDDEKWMLREMDDFLAARPRTETDK